MPITTPYKLAGLGIVAAFGIFGFTACNSDDYRQADRNGTADSSMSSNSATTGGSMTKDTAAAAVKNAAVAASPNTAKIGRKGKVSVIMPSNDASAKMVRDKEGVYNNAEVMPQFPGGQDGLASYVNNHVEYPQMAIDDNTTGIVKVSFVIDENGKVMNAQLVGGGKVGNGLDEEALKVVNNMPPWKPGKVKGKNVKTRLELPIAFQFES